MNRINLKNLKTLKTLKTPAAKTRRLRPLGLALTLAGLGACNPWDIPWDPLPWDSATGGSTSGSGESEASGATAASMTGESAGGTTGEMTEGTADSSTEPTGDQGDTEDTEGMEDLAPPEIVGFDLSPQPMVHHGPIVVEVVTAAAEGVVLRLADGTERDLEADPQDPELFYGEIAATTSLMNGTHTADLIPWAGEVVGEAVAIDYTINLLPPGKELFWEAGDLIGPGEVVAIGHTSDSRVIELGHRDVNGKARCYLRRRDKSGAWKANDLLQLLPGEECEAKDLAVAPTGGIFFLLRRETQQGFRWWVGELSTWGGQPKNRGFGAPGETATALAIHDSGMIAVCGSTTNQKLDGLDAAAWMLKPDLPGETWLFDYEEENNKPHLFAETTRDCAFAGDTLVLVGDAFGKHKDMGSLLFRRFLLEFDTLDKSSTWTVASGEVAAQSFATTIAVDDAGRYYLAGYACDGGCGNLVAELRAYAPGGVSLWKSELGALAHTSWAPHDLAWSPAGYVVVALGGSKGEESAFNIRAYSIDQLEPLWTYGREDNGFFHLAYAVSAGPYGEIAAGGTGMSGYPAIAYIGG